MTRNEAAEAIRSDDNEVRLQAARYYSSHATADDLPLLREIEDVESLPWIQRALRIARERVSAPSVAAAEPVGHIPETEANNTAYSKAVRDVSGKILHELGPLIGGLLISAPDEVSNYPSSQTCRLLTQLSDLSEALRSMRTATATPRFEEIDLSRLVDDIVRAQHNDKGPQIIITGPENFIVSADRAQLSIAFSNGLRNALEAVLTTGKDKPQIVISWGYTGHENWVFIKDSGDGLKFEVSDLFKEGISSKVGHSGYGLPLVREAMASMVGEAILKNDEDGAHFELRWFRKNEDLIR